VQQTSDPQNAINKLLEPNKINAQQ